MKIKKDVEVEGKQTFCATIDEKVGLEMMGSGRSMNLAESEIKNTSLWDFLLQMLECSKTKDETADKFRKCVLIIFPKLPYKLLKENYTSDEARGTLKKFMNILGWRNGGFSYKDKSPPGWPDALSYDDFLGPNSASIEEAMIILRSILLHHQYDPDEHVEVDADNNNGEGEKKKRKRKSKRAKSRALIDPEVEDGNGEEEQVQGAGDIPAERAESQEVELEDGNGNHLVEVTGAENTGLQTSDTEAADDMDQEDSLSESIADAISSAANVDSSEEGEDIMTGQQNKRKAQDDADDSHDEVAQDDADEHDDNSHSVQSEYEKVRDRNVEERQKMINLLGLNSLFAKKPTAANKKKRAKKSPPAEPAEPRKSARLAQKDPTSNI